MDVIRCTECKDTIAQGYNIVKLTKVFCRACYEKKKSRADAPPRSSLHGAGDSEEAVFDETCFVCDEVIPDVFKTVKVYHERLGWVIECLPCFIKHHLSEQNREGEVGAPKSGGEAEAGSLKEEDC